MFRVDSWTVQDCDVPDGSFRISLSGGWWTSMCALRARLLVLVLGSIWPGRRGTYLFITSGSLLTPGIPCDFQPVILRSSETAWRSNHKAAVNAVLLPRFLWGCWGAVNALRSWITPWVCCLQNLAHLWDPIAGLSLSCIKFHMEILLLKVLSPGVPKLLKMCLALYMWVIPTSPSMRPERSAIITQGNRSQSEQNTDVLHKELFCKPFSINSTD